MKINKDALKTARRLFQASFVDEIIDPGRVRACVDRLAQERPRNYLGILSAYHRLLRLEMQKRHALIESAQALPEEVKNSLAADLKQKYGSDLTMEFRVNEHLLGGMKIKVGNDVWDGTVTNRLETLVEQF